MKTVVVGPRPPELDAVIARRRALGHDLHDEVWMGDYHMAPAAHPWHGYVAAQLIAALRAPADDAGLVLSDPFNLGAPDDYRVPDIGLHRRIPDTVFVATTAMVVEIVSPGDETWEKLGFYAEHQVGELLIVDPVRRQVDLLVLGDDGYGPAARSRLLGVEVESLSAAIRWPG